MIFLISNSTTLFFPVFLINYQPDLDPCAIIMVSVEMAAYLLATVITIRGCFIIAKSRVFHPNMNYFICGFCIQWFESVIGRFLMLTYQKGWTQLPGNDPAKPYSMFYTSDRNEMVKIDSFWDCPRLFIGMGLVTHYLVINILCFTAITTERICATCLINDYESKKRPFISWTIFWTCQLSAGLVAIGVCSKAFCIFYWMIIAMILLIVNCLGLTFIWYWNVRVHRILDKSLIIPSKYTLQARFQAKENMKSFNLMKHFLALLVIVLLFQYLLVMCQSKFEFLQKYEIALNYLMEFCNSTHPNMMIPAMMLSVPTWRRRFFYHLKIIPGVQKFVLKAPVVTEQMPNQQLETEEYFNQFRMAWG